MKIRTFQMILATAIAAPLMALASPGHDTHSHTGHGQEAHGDSHNSAAGRPGDKAKVTRTVEVDLLDTMRFNPPSIKVKAGETIKFVVVNKGQLPHEMVIGTDKELDAHADMMRKMPNMKHDDPNQVTLTAGQRGELVWTFDKAGTFAFACLIPGHREAGMEGRFEVGA